MTVENANQIKLKMITLAQVDIRNSTSDKKSSAAKEEGHNDSIESTGRNNSLQATSDAWSHACRMTREKMAQLLAEISCIEWIRTTLHALSEPLPNLGHDAYTHA